MKLCPECVTEEVCCDHCAFYQFNGVLGKYTGDGWCRLHKNPQEPGDKCEDYFCFKLLGKK
jgi:hypothetical protein